MGVGGQCDALAAFTPEKDPVPIVQEAGWAPGPVWLGAENLASTGIRSPDLAARSESLYRLIFLSCSELPHHSLTITDVGGKKQRGSKPTAHRPSTHCRPVPKTGKLNLCFLNV